jgi:hypothetical protein
VNITGIRGRISKLERASKVQADMPVFIFSHDYESEKKFQEAIEHAHKISRNVRVFIAPKGCGFDRK